LQKLWEFLDMATGCTVGRIPGVSEHGRAWGAGEKKEDDEGMILYLTCSKDASRWPDFAGEEGGDALLRTGERS
jgi:hypothetical protein